MARLLEMILIARNRGRQHLKTNSSREFANSGETGQPQRWNWGEPRLLIYLLGIRSCCYRVSHFLFTSLVSSLFGPNFVLQNAVLEARGRKPQPRPRMSLNPHVLFLEEAGY